MKVIEIYDKNSNIMDHGKNIFKTTSEYLKRYPQEYSKCYYKNLETLELIKVDRLDDKSKAGVYNPEANNILFSREFSLGHELIHMATNDINNQQFAFESKLYIEDGLIEGMTEYHHMKAYNLKLPGSYSFEVFTVTMMENIPNLFEPFFVPKEKGILDICSDKIYIYGLLYSLNAYNQMMLDFLDSEYNGNEVLIDKVETRRAIRHVIDNLISIELSIENDLKKLNEYGDKFMDLISSDFVGDIVPLFYSNYITYADKEIKKRIRSKN